MHLHLDPLGGWSGDMFVAAMLDAFPEHWADVRQAIAALDLGAGADCALQDHRDAALTGRRFVVAAEAHSHPHDHGPHHHEPHDHTHHGHEESGAHAHGPHRAWAEIRRLIDASPLPGAVRRHAIGIFTLLAEAEAEVHCVAPDEVMFHEVGAVDSIVDIVAAATLVDLVGATAWTSAPLPIGSGRVRTAHGILPVPAPATALLLRGLVTMDDGIPGERVTPTGAAVARHLLGAAPTAAGRGPGRLLRTGSGFGQRRLPGLANCLRVLAYEPLPDPVGPIAGGAFAHRDLAVIAFEVDDQTPEDLAVGLDHLRAVEGVHDAAQGVMIGKKGRFTTHVQVLVAPAHLDRAIEACFEETTTIGLRYHMVHGAVLARRFDAVETARGPVRVKAVTRPGPRATAKAEAGDVAAVRGHEDRVRLRREAEAAALGRLAKDDAHD